MSRTDAMRYEVTLRAPDAEMAWAEPFLAASDDDARGFAGDRAADLGVVVVRVERNPGTPRETVILERHERLPLTTTDLNGLVALALGRYDAPPLDWERDPDTDGGWVAEWSAAEDAREVARYIQEHFDLEASTSSGSRYSVLGGRVSTWLWVGPRSPGP